jgi:hypothetical protein
MSTTLSNSFLNLIALPTQAPKEQVALRKGFGEAAARLHQQICYRAPNIGASLSRIEALPRRVFDPAAMAQDFDAVALFTDAAAAACKDEGGQPPMRAFKVLAAGLIRAYRRATAQKGTGHGSREGRLLDLVETVLPTARAIAKRVTGKPLRTPSEKNLGEQLNEIAKRHSG